MPAAKKSVRKKAVSDSAFSADSTKKVKKLESDANVIRAAKVGKSSKGFEDRINKTFDESFKDYKVTIDESAKRKAAKKKGK